MKKYIGVKIVDAEPMNLGDYNLLRGWTIPDDEDPKRPGSRVVYKDGYVSWSPEEAFKTYHPMECSDSVSIKDVNHWIKDVEVSSIDEKTTLVKATLVNGFVLIEASSCVDPENYDEKVGAGICIDKIRDQVWHLLGFLLQCSKMEG